MTWLNWSLKFHSGLRTIPHLILTHNTQDFSSINAYFICVIVHDQMWCVCSIACRSNPKRFLSILYVFESVFMLSCFKFLFKMHFCVVLQKLLQRHFCENLATKHFLRKEVKAKTGNHKISYRNFHDCLATISQLKASRERFCASEVFFASNSASI